MLHQIIERTFAPSVLTAMLNEARTITLHRNNALYPKCSDITETIAPICVSALKQFGAETLNKSMKHCQLNQMEHGNSIPWHNDLQVGTEDGLMLYLTEDVFDLNTGGYLELGVTLATLKHDEGNSATVSDSEVYMIQRIFPKMGLGVLFDNRNPGLVHRVETLRQNKERYTILALY